jgi:hypothetical protein
MAFKCCMVAPKVCGPLVWKLLHVTPLVHIEGAPRLSENLWTPVLGTSVSAVFDLKSLVMQSDN